LSQQGFCRGKPGDSRSDNANAFDILQLHRMLRSGPRPLNQSNDGIDEDSENPKDKNV
jgi:hypothetical protein